MKKILSILFGTLLVSSCYKEKDYEQQYGGATFTLTSSSNSIPADSASKTVITVEIPPNAADTFSIVTLKTSAGTFDESGAKTLSVKAKKPFDKDVRRVEATLRSGSSVEEAVVTVEFFDFKKDVKVAFTRAYPTQLKLSVASFSVKPSNKTDGEINIEAQAIKATGKPSVGQLVTVNAYDSLYSKTLGSFRMYNPAINGEGKANFVFVLGDSVANKMDALYTGPLFIVGTMESEVAGELVADTIKIISSN